MNESNKKLNYNKEEVDREIEEFEGAIFVSNTELKYVGDTRSQYVFDITVDGEHMGYGGLTKIFPRDHPWLQKVEKMRQDE